MGFPVNKIRLTPSDMTPSDIINRLDIALQFFKNAASSPMNSKPFLPMLAVLASFSTGLLAADPFPNQPKMAAAYNNLNAALNQLEKADLHLPGPHRKNAILDLAAAKTALDEAAKNKGSYVPKAKSLIDDATKLLEAAPLDDNDRKKAMDTIKIALTEVNKGAHAGSH